MQGQISALWVRHGAGEGLVLETAARPVRHMAAASSAGQERRKLARGRQIGKQPPGHGLKGGLVLAIKQDTVASGQPVAGRAGRSADRPRI
jgi:hypothetical protein